MISSFKIANQGKRLTKKYEWAHNVPFIMAGDINFTPGLNIVFGPNGSGKSTLISLCAEILCAKQAGYSCITKTAIEDVCGWMGEEHFPATIAHDGQPVVYVNSRQAFGLYNNATFDDEFMVAGMRSLEQNQQSSGQISASRINDAIKIIMESDNPVKAKEQAEGKSKTKGRRMPASYSLQRKPRFADTARFPEKIEAKVSRENFNDLWAKRYDRLEAILQPTIEAGPRTILMDEPESGFSLLWQANFWHNVMESKQACNFQIIVATHSPFSLGIPGANYIETEPGYVKQCLELFSAIKGR